MVARRVFDDTRLRRGPSCPIDPNGRWLGFKSEKYLAQNSFPASEVDYDDATR
jgi:hypothetical protein